MPVRCTVCFHPSRAAIEALEHAQTSGQISEAFGVSWQSVRRHFRDHDRVAQAATPRGRSRVAPHAAPTGRSVVPAAPPLVSDDPVETFARAVGRDAMPHQVEYLRETRDLLVLKGRQVGMSTAGGVLGVHTALSRPRVLVAIVSPSMKQSTEVTEKCRNAAVALGATMRKDASGLLEFENRSRVVSLAGTARAVRGWSAHLLIIDEAAFVEPATFAAARATTIATGGRTIVQSTPGNPVGTFYDMWQSELPAWARIRVRSDEAATISREELERFRRELSPAEFAQEYEAEFGETVSGVRLWTEEEWRALIRPAEED